MQEALESNDPTEIVEKKDESSEESKKLTEEELDVEFDEGYGIPFGKPFTLWTTWHVYFPVCYDGSEWCGSVYRNPTKIATQHQGGY